jgi:hypothetical protein
LKRIVEFFKSLVERFIDKLAEKVGDNVKWLVIIAAAAIVAITVLILQRACSGTSVNQTVIQTVNQPAQPTTNIFITVVVPGLMAPVQWNVYVVHTNDDSGNALDFEVGVLWDRYRWLIGSAEYVGIDEREKEYVQKVITSTPNDETRPIIVVGTASHENASEHLEDEVFRASTRADKLVDICQKHFVNKPQIYSVNLGAFKHTDASTVESALERRVILLVITKRENNADLNSGVRNGLIKLHNEYLLEFDPTGYSNFTPAKFHVKPRTPIR